MDWNNFFKLTWKKIIVTIIVFGILFFVWLLFQNLYGGACGQLCPAGQVNYVVPGSDYCNCMDKSEADMLNLKYNLVIFVILLVISYLVSCLIFILQSFKN